MLRITPIARSRRRIVLKLEGWLISEWALELDRECRRLLADGRTVLLDCAAITFVDSAGAETLRGLKKQGVELINGSHLLDDFLGSSRRPGEP